MAGQTCPMAALDVLSAGFLENRARLLEVAAFLDRIERAGDPGAAREDFRYQALQGALALLTASSEGRARALQACLSDPTSEPRESAKGLKGASGAWDGGKT